MRNDLKVNLIKQNKAIRKVNNKLKTLKSVDANKKKKHVWGEHYFFTAIKHFYTEMEMSAFRLFASTQFIKNHQILADLPLPDPHSMHPLIHIG